MGEHLYDLLHLGIILLAAGAGGALAKRFNQPAVLGQIIAGILLGMGMIEKTVLIASIGEIGVVFLLFIAGLETDVTELKASGKSSSLIAIGGVLAPALLVFAATYIFLKDPIPAAFLALVSTATSVGISVQTLREIGQMRTREGLGILGAAIIDDVVGILLLTLFVGTLVPQADSSMVLVVGKIVAFFLIVGVVGYGLRRLVDYLGEHVTFDDRIVTLALVTCFFFAFLSEELGVAAITGAYFTGVIFSMTPHRHRVSHEIDRLASLFFVPVFFVSIGMGVNLTAALSALGVGSLLILFGMLGKIMGCYGGARLSGFDGRSALQIGIGMVPRAEVAIIITNLGVRMGFLTEHHLAAVLLMVVATTLVTPALLKMSFAEPNPVARHA